LKPTIPNVAWLSVYCPLYAATPLSRHSYFSHFPKQPHINFPHTILSLSKNQLTLFDQTALNPKTLPVHMAFRQNQLQLRYVYTRTDGGTPDASGHSNFRRPPVRSASLPGTGFKNPPPLAILFKPFQFLKCLGLKSVGLGLDCVPFHSG